MNKPSNKVISALLINIMLMGGLSACDKFKSVDSMLSEAKSYQQKGDTKAAMIQLKSAVQKAPDNAEARYMLGALYNKTGDAKSAEKELRKALSLGMAQEKALPELTHALLSDGQFQHVLDETKALAGENESLEISLARGNAYLALGQKQEAKAAFERALKNKPDTPLGLIGLARLALSDNKIDDAMQLVNQAENKNPQDIVSRLFKGDLLRAQDDQDQAIAAYDSVLKIQPDNVTALVNKAYLHIMQAKYADAKTSLDIARKKVAGNLLVIYTQALLDFRQSNNKVALEAVQQVLKVAPDHMPSVLLAGSIQLALGSLPQAEAHLKKYLEKDASNMHARKMMASLLLKQRQTQRAKEMLEPMLEKEIPDPQLYMIAGELFMMTGDFSKATDYFAKASELAPKAPLLRSALGLSKLAQGKNEQGIAELEAAAELDKQSNKTDILLISTLMRLQQYDKAMKVVNDLEKNKPNDPMVHNLKGGVYLAKKDIISARAAFDKTLSIQPDNMAAMMNLVQLDLFEKKTDAAKKRLEDALAKDKKNIQVMHALAALALGQKQIKEATSWFEKAADANADSLQPSLVLVAHYVRAGEKEKAIKLAQKLYGANSEKPDAIDALAQAQLANDDKQGALDSYNRLVSLMPKSAKTYYHIALIYMEMKKPELAEASLKKILEMQPDHIDAQKALVMIAAGKGDYKQAFGIVQQMQQKQPKSPEGNALEGDLYMAQKKPEFAMTAYDKALSKVKYGPLLMKWHVAAMQAGKSNVANARVQQWLKEQPNDVQVRMYLASALLANKQLQAAQEHFQIVVQQVPNNIAALNNLAWLYQQAKDKRALEMAEKANQLAPNSPAIMDTLGWILLEQGSVAKALPLLENAHKVAPESPEIHYHLVVAMAKNGDKAGARRELDKLLATGKQFPLLNEAKSFGSKLSN